MTTPAPQPLAADEEIKIRYNFALGLSALVVGVLSLAVGLVNPISFLPGIALTLLGSLYMAGRPVAVITLTRVQQKSPIGLNGKVTEIRGFADLELRGKVLHRRGDGTKIMSLGSFAANSQDVAALDRRIAGALSAHS